VGIAIHEVAVYCCYNRVRAALREQREQSSGGRAPLAATLLQEGNSFCELVD
jgi:hypothetical protein